MSFWCNHEWEKKSEIVLPSAYEQYIKDVKKCGGGDYPPWSFVKTHIMIMICKKCGRVYKSVEKSGQ